MEIGILSPDFAPHKGPGVVDVADTVKKHDLWLFSEEKTMVDEIDASASTLRLLVSQALKTWPIAGLLKLITDDDSIVRTAAARELQVRGGHNIFEEVVKLVDDNRPYVREIVAFTLGQIGTPNMPYKTETWPFLIRFLEDDAGDVRAAAVKEGGHP